MNKYFLRFYADTGFSIGHRTEHVKGKEQAIDITSGLNWHIYCHEKLEQIDNKFVFSGLTFDAYIEEESPEKAKKIIETACFNILNLLAISCLSPWRNLKTIEAYDATSGLSKRVFEAYFTPNEPGTIQKTIRVLDLSTFSSIQQAFDKSPYQDSLLASFHQLNKGLQSETDVDEFIAYWTGVEYLADSLNKKAKCIKSEKFYTCPNCAADLVKCQKCKGELAKHNYGAGIYKRVEELTGVNLGISRKQFNEIVKVRSVIIHGGSWDTFSQANYFKNLARKIQIYCICDLLDFPKDFSTLLADKEPIIRNRTTTLPWIVHKAELEGHNDEIPIQEYKSQPSVEATGTTTNPTKIDDEGKVQFSATNNYKYNGKKGVVWTNRSTILLIHEKSGAKNINLSMD